MDSFHPFDQNGHQSFSNGFGQHTYNNGSKQEHFDDLSNPNPSFFGQSSDYQNPFYAMQTLSLSKDNESVCDYLCGISFLNTLI